MFEYVHNADGTCHMWSCGRPGVFLVYDDFQPEYANWFCSDCWDWFEGPHCTMFKIAIDRRPYIGPSHQITETAEIRLPIFERCACWSLDAYECFQARHSFRDPWDGCHDEYCQCGCHSEFDEEEEYDL